MIFVENVELFRILIQCNRLMLINDHDDRIEQV